MSNTNNIAVVGYACRYPEASSPDQLWENILSQRRAFRNMPVQRLSPDYFSSDKKNLDSIYSKQVAVLKNYFFDRNRFKISNTNYNTADLTHWLALEVAADALENAGLCNMTDEVRTKTGVIIGNTLTGEFSRSNVLRLRWPYVAKSLASSLKDAGMDTEVIQNVLKKTEKKFKNAFPEMEEDSLAGGLSNTIAGRICNYFDFHGGGYTIDGACSSSLLAVSKACDAIVGKDILIAVVGGVDLSLDPFELVGFSRAGALATKKMLVYDKNSNGFWPGEGCGFIVLSDYAYAVNNNLNISGVIKGWGISSDGKGGLTRPNAEQQYLAIKRCYEKAGYGINTVKYIEGHGTGTAVGDTVELHAIAKATEEYTDSCVFIGSVKANIGHTKAAAGMAGIIKALLILQNKIIPPVTGCINPHPDLEKNHKINITDKPVLCSSNKPLRVGISSMGFGGINVHVTVQEYKKSQRKEISKNEKKLVRSVQDTELFLFSAENSALLKEKLLLVLDRVKEASYAELIDISASLYDQLHFYKCRLALEASTPDDFLAKLEEAILVIDKGESYNFNTDKNIYYSSIFHTGKIGFLFPGQGNSALTHDGLLIKRYPFIKELIPGWPGMDFEVNELIGTNIAQPAIVATSITAVELLKSLGVTCDIALGHSVGEISALFCSGSIDRSDAISLAIQRGLLMHISPEVKGAMLSVMLSPDDTFVATLLENFKVSLACINSTKQIVFSGNKEIIQEVHEYCSRSGITSSVLKVENAFHSSLMKSIEPDFEKVLDKYTFQTPILNMYSSVTGELLSDSNNVKSNLCKQLSEPVLFYKAFRGADKEAGIWIEAGSGNVLKNIATELTLKPVVSLDLVNNSVKGLLQVAALLFTTGHLTNLDNLFSGRFYRNFSFEEKSSFIENPCESVPLIDDIKLVHDRENVLDAQATFEKDAYVIDKDLRQLFISHLSGELGLPDYLVQPGSRMLDDFHLNSLFVGNLLSEFAVKYKLELTKIPTEYANASVEEITTMFEMLNNERENKRGSVLPKEEQKNEIDGIGSWVYPFEIVKKIQPLILKKKIDFVENKGQWDIIGAIEKTALQDIRESLSLTGRNGLLVILFSENEEELLSLLDRTAKIIVQKRELNNIILVQNKPVSSGFFKSIFQEIKSLNILIINCAGKDINATIIKNEITELHGFAEVYYENNERLVPYLSPHLSSIDRGKTYRIAEKDLIVISGGAKGITFECVRSLASNTGCKLILLGRAEPNSDEIIYNLSALQQQGIFANYYSCDISNPIDCANIFKEITNEFGQISGIVHGAGINYPRKISAISQKELTEVLAPKLYGLRNIISNIDISKLKFCFAFGSVIAETGMEGNADYALANEWLRNEMVYLKNLYPDTYFVNLEWSVWGGTGMGQKLNVLEELQRKGIRPISLDDGISFFNSLFIDTYRANNLIITSRFGNDLLLNVEEPLNAEYFRFVDNIIVFCPKTELISEFFLTEKHDLYLKDHIIDNQIIFPAVLAMEAMAQAVNIINEGLPASFSFRELEFMQPVIIKKGESRRIRIIVQRMELNTYKVVLRDEATGFLKDYFKAVISTELLIDSQNEFVAGAMIPLEINVQKELYNNILFQKGLFQRLKCYNYLTPYSLSADTVTGTKPQYFSDFLPQNLILTDPGIRDSAFHAVQACVPGYTLLPIKMGVCNIFRKRDGIELCTIQALETGRNGDVFIYNILIFDENKEIIEEWIDVHFKILHLKKILILSASLIKNVLQRKLDEVRGERNCCTLKFNSGDHDIVIKRNDGKPLIGNGFQFTKSHSDTIEISLKSRIAIACDVERVIHKTNSQWQKLLGDSRYKLAKSVKQVCGEDDNQAGTRVWGAVECLRKSGNSLFSPIIIKGKVSRGIVYFTSGDMVLISFRCIMEDTLSDMVFTILIKTGDEKI